LCSYAFLSLWLRVEDTRRALLWATVARALAHEGLPKGVFRRPPRVRELFRLAEVPTAGLADGVIARCMRLEMPDRALFFLENAASQPPLEDLIAMNARANRMAEGRALAQQLRGPPPPALSAALQDWEAVLTSRADKRRRGPDYETGFLRLQARAP
jgi:hypothetical protein